MTLRETSCISATSIRFRVDGTPVPKARARVVNGHSFTPKRTADAEKVIALTARVAGVQCRKGPVALRCWFFFADKRRRDLDNCVKTVQDALNGIAWDDDSQIVWLEAAKYQVKVLPYTMVEISDAESVVDVAPEAIAEHLKAHQKLWDERALAGEPPVR